MIYLMIATMKKNDVKKESKINKKRIKPTKIVLKEKTKDTFGMMIFGINNWDLKCLN